MKVAVLGYGTVGLGVYEMLKTAKGLEPGPVLVRPGKDDAPFKVTSIEAIVNDPEVGAAAAGFQLRCGSTERGETSGDLQQGAGCRQGYRACRNRPGARSGFPVQRRLRRGRPLPASSVPRQRERRNSLP